MNCIDTAVGRYKHDKNSWTSKHTESMFKYNACCIYCRSYTVQVVHGSRGGINYIDMGSFLYSYCQTKKGIMHIMMCLSIAQYSTCCICYTMLYVSCFDIGHCRVILEKAHWDIIWLVSLSVTAMAQAEKLFWTQGAAMICVAVS